MSCVKCHVSCVMCHMSCFTWHGTPERERKTLGGVKVVKLVGGGSVIKGATSSSLKMQTEPKTLGKDCTVVFLS